MKGMRQIAFLQVAREEEAIAASEAGMDMIGTAFIPSTESWPALVPISHFQFSLPWGKTAGSNETLHTYPQAQHNVKMSDK